jgi:hypothetical protein
MEVTVGLGITLIVGFFLYLCRYHGNMGSLKPSRSEMNLSEMVQEAELVGLSSKPKSSATNLGS